MIDNVIHHKLHKLHNCGVIVVLQTPQTLQTPLEGVVCSVDVVWCVFCSCC